MPWDEDMFHGFFGCISIIKKKPLRLLDDLYGRGSRIRTYGSRSQSPLPYRLAIPLYRVNMGWDEGFEPSIFGSTIRRFDQLSQSHHIVARQRGLEPPTHGLEGRCSIQLSYWHSMERVKGIEPSQPAWKAGALPLSYTRDC